MHTLLVPLAKIVRPTMPENQKEIDARVFISSHKRPNPINLILLAAHSQPPITKLNTSSAFEQHLHPRPYHPRGRFVSPPRAEHMFFSPVQMHRTQPLRCVELRGDLVRGTTARTHECILHLLQRVRSQQRRRRRRR